MNAIAAARALGALKVVAGGACVVAPELAAHWAGRDARTDAGRQLARMFGIRDAMFGLGLVAAADADGELRRWLILSSACDAIDFAAALGTRPSPGRTGMLVAAASATAGQLLMAAKAEPS